MSDPQTNLPASFEKAHDLAPIPAPDKTGPFFTGTITQSGKIPHFERGMYITIADVALDENPLGLKTAKLISLHNNHDIEGRRVRGLLMLDEKSQRDVRAHGITGYDWAHTIMKQASAAYFDFRSFHLAADDPELMKSGNVIAENRSVLGFARTDRAKDYYLAHGYDVTAAPTIDITPNPWQKLMGALNHFKKPETPNPLQLK